MSSKSVTLHRSEIEKLCKVVEHFTEVQHFNLEISHESGIGPTVRVKFNLFDNSLPNTRSDTVVDITDVSNW